MRRICRAKLERFKTGEVVIYHLITAAILVVGYIAYATLERSP